MEKKPIITLLILGTTIATTSCNKADRDRDYETLWGLNRPVKSFTVHSYEATSKFGEPTKGDLEEVYTVNFNEDGNTESIKKYDPNGDLKEVAKFKYDENGLRTKQNLYDSDGALNMTIRYEYEGDKVCKMSIQSDYLNQEVISKWEGDYLKETETYTDGEFSGSTEYTKQNKAKPKLNGLIMTQTAASYGKAQQPLMTTVESLNTDEEKRITKQNGIRICRFT